MNVVRKLTSGVLGYFYLDAMRGYPKAKGLLLAVFAAAVGVGGTAYHYGAFEPKDEAAEALKKDLQEACAKGGEQVLKRGDVTYTITCSK